ncbi:hypothetical protein TRVA0_006S03202 [Trichomonascus vanleenenianus]|uniref:uncharacterized protein n=1 Tax=Trichomonascus vanleenenianus TaxID=2268995 RepID=UPI003ECB73E8
MSAEMSRLSKTVVLKYRDSSKKENDNPVPVPVPDATTTSAKQAPPSELASSSSSPVSSSSSSKPVEDLIDVTAVRAAIGQLYTYNLDEDELWKAKADEVALALNTLRNRWKELDAIRKASVKPVRGAGIAPKGPGRRPGRKPKRRD